jgi:hypothetical protein
VFPSQVGTPVDASHVRRSFRLVMTAADLDLASGLHVSGGESNQGYQRRLKTKYETGTGDSGGADERDGCGPRPSPSQIRLPVR